MSHWRVLQLACCWRSTFRMFSGLNPLYLGWCFRLVARYLLKNCGGVYKHYQELAIPIILSGGIGLGVIFISLANGFNTDLFSYLFGSVSAVSQDRFMGYLDY